MDKLKRFEWFAAIVLLVLFVVVALLVILTPAEAAAQTVYQKPVITTGVVYETLPKPVTFAMRYPLWEHNEDAKAASWPFGFADLVPPTLQPKVIARQNQDLDELGIACDLLQYDPTSISDILNVRSYLPRNQRCFALMYESVSVHGYLREPSGLIDMCRFENVTNLLVHMRNMYFGIIQPYQDQYLVSEVPVGDGLTEKRAWVYFWNLNPYAESRPGCMESLFAGIQALYPIYLVGGDLGLQPPWPPEETPTLGPGKQRQRERQIQHIGVMDAILHYTPYDATFEGTYLGLVNEYDRAMREWRQAIDHYSPGTLLFSSALLAFEDFRIRGDRNPRRVPANPSQVKMHLQNNTQLYLEGIVDGGVAVVWDEVFEGMAWDRNLRHVQPFLFWDGGINLLRNYMEFFFPPTFKHAVPAPMR